MSYQWHPYPRMLEQMFRMHAMPKVLAALVECPQTVVELSRGLGLPIGLVRFTIQQLRRMGHTLENRDSWCGKPPRRGRYHLIKVPGVDYIGSCWKITRMDGGILYAQTGGATW